MANITKELDRNYMTSSKGKVLKREMEYLDTATAAVGPMRVATGEGMGIPEQGQMSQHN